MILVYAFAISYYLFVSLVMVAEELAAPSGIDFEQSIHFRSISNPSNLYRVLVFLFAMAMERRLSGRNFEYRSILSFFLSSVRLFLEIINKSLLNDGILDREKRMKIKKKTCDENEKSIKMIELI